MDIKVKKYGFPLFTHEEPTGYLHGNKEEILVSDLWSFWIFLIKQWSKKQKIGVSSFLLSLLEQSKFFYEAAEKAPLNSKPLLYYYSFLNLGKIIITMRGKSGTTPQNGSFNHGISADPKNKSITIKPMLNSKCISVGYHLMNCFGDNVASGTPTTIDIFDAMKNCLGIHNPYCLVMSQKKENFIKITGIELSKEGRDFVARLYLKSTNQLTEQIYSIKKNNDRVYWEERISIRNSKPTKIDYYKLSQQIIQKGIWTYTDGKEYNMYVSSYTKVRYTSASLIYCLMFYFGSITRYQPHLFETFLSDKQKWLVAEFLQTQPKQFLYISTSLAAEAYVTVPKEARL